MNALSLLCAEPGVRETCWHQDRAIWTLRPGQPARLSQEKNSIWKTALGCQPVLRLHHLDPQHAVWNLEQGVLILVFTRKAACGLLADSPSDPEKINHWLEKLRQVAS